MSQFDPFAIRARLIEHRARFADDKTTLDEKLATELTLSLVEARQDRGAAHHLVQAALVARADRRSSSSWVKPHRIMSATVTAATSWPRPSRREARGRPMAISSASAVELATVHPTRIDATVVRPGFVDIVVEWSPGVPSRFRIPAASAAALGADLAALACPVPPRARPVPPLAVARFPGPASLRLTPAAEAAALPRRGRSRRAGSSSLAPTLFAWGLMAGLAVAAIALWVSGVGHVAD